MASDEANQRRYMRIDVSLPVQIRNKQGAIEVLTANISRSGVFLRTDTPMPERQLVKLGFKMPDGTPLQVMGMVVHRFLPKDKHPAGPGMGIHFFALSKNDKKTWDRFCLEMEKNSARLQISTQVQAELTIPGEGGFADPDEVLDLIDEIEIDVFAPATAGFVEPVRRENPRYAASFLVRLPDKEQMYEYYTKDISIGGTFIHAKELRKDGEILELILVHPESNEEFSLEATVVRVIEGPAEYDRGMGLEFTPLDNNRKRELELFIEIGVAFQEDSPEASAERVADLHQAVSLEADSPRAYTELARLLLEEKEDPEAAVEKLLHALALDADYLPAHELLRLAYALAGKRDRALAHLRIARRLRVRPTL